MSGLHFFNISGILIQHRLEWNMPPWETIPPQTYSCQSCGNEFQAKRMAKYCTPICQNRSRPARSFTPEQRRKWREQRLQTDGYREKVNLQANTRAAKVRDWLDAYKVEHGCHDCGYQAHAVALDFDHVWGEKIINVCNAKSIAQAKSEIEKCEVVCANCHRIRTAIRLGVRH